MNKVISFKTLKEICGYRYIQNINKKGYVYTCEKTEKLCSYKNCHIWNRLKDAK